MIVRVLRRAVADTVQGQIAALFMLIAGGVLSLLYLYVTESSTVATDEIPYVSGVIFGAFGALGLYFLWNLVCAPFRIERDEHTATKARLKALEDSMPNYGVYEGDHEQLMLFVVNDLFPLMGLVDEMARAIPEAPQMNDDPVLSTAMDSLGPLNNSPVEYVPLPTMIAAVNDIEKHYAPFLRSLDDAVTRAKLNPTDIPGWLAWGPAHEHVRRTYEEIKRNSRLGELFRPSRPSRWGNLAPPYSSLTVGRPFLRREDTPT